MQPTFGEKGERPDEEVQRGSRCWDGVLRPQGVSSMRDQRRGVLGVASG
jgi:hypothetical protein